MNLGKGNVFTDSILFKEISFLMDFVAVQLIEQINKCASEKIACNI